MILSGLLPLVGKNKISPARPETQKSSRSRPPGSHNRHRWAPSIRPDLSPGARNLVWYDRKGMLSMQCENWTHQWREQSYYIMPPAQTFIFPASASSNRRNGEQGALQTSTKPLISWLMSISTKRWQSTSVSSHLYRELTLPTRPDPENLLVIVLREL